MIAYLITNHINNKQYVGLTTRSLNKRWNDHVGDNANTVIHKAIKKHGKENFTIQPIASAIGNINNLKELEKQLIEQYDTYLNGYNSTKGGDGVFGYKKTLEQIENHRQKMIGFKHTNETIQKMCIAHKGKKKPRTEEHSRKIGLTKLGNTNNLGKKRTNESKALMSASRLKYLFENEAPSGNRKGLILAKNIATGEEVVIDGHKDMLKHGFTHTNVYRCVLGKRKTHKGYIFRRLEN